MNDTLRALGLTDGETKVYLALVGLGETTSGPIVEQSGVSVSKVYIILDKLAHKGLASHVVKSKVKYFKAAQPERLRDFLKEKQQELSKQQEQVEALIPQLRAKQQSVVTEETAQVFDGLRGIQTARERTLHIMKKSDEMWIIGIAPSAYDRLSPYFADYHERRYEKGIVCHFLYNEEARKPFGERSASFPLSKVRYLANGIITHAWMEIYADTVTIGINHQQSFSIVVQNQEVADSFKAYARLLWSLGKK